MSRLLPCIKCLPLLLVLAFAACGTVGHPIVGIDNFDQVSPELFRGAQPSAQGIRTLAAMHVQTVINLRDDDDPREAAELRAAGMTYVHIPLDAETVTPADADRVLATLTEAKGPVFVHCLVGRDRTGMAVAAYRMNVQGWTQQAAVKDLYDHGHFWIWFPKVREAIAHLAEKPIADSQVVSAEAGGAVARAVRAAAN